MNIKQKISCLLEKVDELSLITLENEPIKIHQMEFFKGSSEINDHEEIIKILLKLEEEKIIKIIQIATDVLSVPPPEEGYIDEKFFFILKKDENFKNYYKNLEEELYPEKSKQKNNEIAYEVTYNEKDRKILINNFLLAKVDFDSVNEWVFSYLYKNIGKKIAKDKLEKERGEKIKKSLHDIVKDLGFTGDLKTLFFQASEKSIKFTKTITFQDLKDLKIDFIRIQEKK